MARPIRYINEPAPIAQHAWRTLAVGRICDNCLEVQAKGEFSELPPCPRAKLPVISSDRHRSAEGPPHEGRPEGRAG